LNLFKIIGGTLIVLGFAFRAISIAYFNLREKSLPDDAKIRRKFLAKKRRALFIDAAFIAFGFLVLLEK